MECRQPAEHQGDLGIACHTGVGGRQGPTPCLNQGVWRGQGGAGQGEGRGGVLGGRAGTPISAKPSRLQPAQRESFEILRP